MAGDRCAIYVDFDKLLGTLRAATKGTGAVWTSDRLAAALPNLVAWIRSDVFVCSRLRSGVHKVRSYSPVVERAFVYIDANKNKNACLALMVGGFLIRDCPARSAGKKNGADIALVIDIMRAIYFDDVAEPLRYYVIGNDSDYIPLARELHDRKRTCVVYDARDSVSDFNRHFSAWIDEAELFRILTSPSPTPCADLTRAPSRQLDEADAIQRMLVRTAEQANSARKSAIRFLGQQVHEKGPVLLAQVADLLARNGHTPGPRWFDTGTLSRLIDATRSFQPQLRYDARWLYYVGNPPIDPGGGDTAAPPRQLMLLGQEAIPAYDPPTYAAILWALCTTEPPAGPFPTASARFQAVKAALLEKGINLPRTSYNAVSHILHVGHKTGAEGIEDRWMAGTAAIAARGQAAESIDHNHFAKEVLALFNGWGDRRGLNPQPPVPQTGALTN